MLLHKSPFAVPVVSTGENSKTIKNLCEWHKHSQYTLVALLWSGTAESLSNEKNSRLTDPPNFSFALDSSSDVDPPYHVSVGLHAEILLHRQAGNRQVGTAVDTVLSCSFGPGILHASQEL